MTEKLRAYLYLLLLHENEVKKHINSHTWAYGIYQSGSQP
jgi:hypothetical protein